MGMFIQKVELNNQQLEAIDPVINAYMQKYRMTKKDKQAMETECLEAMELAGCPLDLSLAKSQQ